MGIKYNNNKISQKSSDAQYPYYNNTQIAQVYYNGTLVWKKFTVLPFTFSGNTVTGYTGSATSFTIPSSYYVATDIDGSTFYTSTAIGSATSVTAIGDDAFADNTTITSVTIPSSIKTIGARAFQKCYNLATVSMSATPTSIGYCAFAVTNITPSSYMYNCTSLGQGCFATRKAWKISGLSAAQTERIRATTLGTLSSGNYTGYGHIFYTYFYFGVRHSSGTNTPSMSATFTGKISAGIQTITYPTVTLTMGNYGAPGTSYVYNSSSNPPTLSASYTVNSSGNVSSHSGENNSLGYFTTSDGIYAYRLDYYVNVVSTCIAKGTSILLANGLEKPIETITHEDLLLVWNFETGSYDYQYPLVVGQGNTTTCKTRIVLENAAYIDICGTHDLYDPVAHIFRKYGEGAIIELQDKPLYVLYYEDKNTYYYYKIIDIKVIWEETDCYCLMTSGTLTAFANNILIGSDILNQARISESNKFPDSFANDKTLCYTYDKFKDEIYSKGSKYLILGLNIHYVHYYDKDTMNFKETLAPFSKGMLPKLKNNKYMCTIGLLDDDILIESNYLEDEEITLPNIKAKDKTQWYVVGEYKFLQPGDTYKVNYSTLIRAI